MTNKQKNSALIFGFIAMLFIAYQLSFRKTIEAKTSLNKLIKDRELLANAGERKMQLELENKHLDAILIKNDVSANQSFEQNLFQKITKLSKEFNSEIVSFEKPHSFQAEGANMLSYTIQLKGSFRNLMLLTSNLEKQRLGKFSSTSFVKKKNYRTGRNELATTIILQKLSK